MAKSRTRRAGALASTIALATLFLLLGGSASVSANDDRSTWDLPPEVPRPDFIRNRPLIPDRLLKDKRDGWYVTGIPAIGYDAEEGFTGGAFAEIYNNGERDDPFFRTAPYRQMFFVGGTVSSEEVVRILGRVDWPYMFDSPYRFRLDSLFARNPIENYFGIGDAGIDLVSPRTGRTHTSFTKYQKDLDQFVAPGVDGCSITETRCTNARYNKLQSREFLMATSLERDLLGGRLRPLIGFQVRYVDIDDLTGKRVKQIAGGSSKGTQLPTRLLEDCAAGVIIGCGGGWDNYFRFGLTYDSRNFEPNPGRGILAEMIASVSSKVIGSEEDYQRVTFSVSGFHDFLETRPTTRNKLTVAGRAVYNMQFGDVPLTGLQRLGFADFDRRGAGGFLTLRGFKNQRFIGESAVLLAGEIRYFFTEWQFWGQHLVPGVAAFIDTGRAFTDVDFKFKDWQVAGGGGFRLAWNLATMVSFDVGVSGEDAIFYMELGTSF